MNLKNILKALSKNIFGKSNTTSHQTQPKVAQNINGDANVMNGVVAYNQYGGYFTPLSSQQRPAVQRILKGNVHEPDTIAFIRAHCKDGDVVHAGTFFGDFLPGISTALNTGSMLWAFEPNAENFKCAEITVLINQLKNIQLFNAGLGNVKTKSNLIVKSEDGINLGGMSYITEEAKDEEAMEVDVFRIDDTVPAERYISILQLDVEGYEKQALMGAIETIKRNKPIIILEDNNKIAESKWFEDTIMNLGYARANNLHHNSVFQTKH